MLDDIHWKRIGELFDKAMGLDTEAERSELLNHETTIVRSRVQQLLHDFEHGNDFLETPAILRDEFLTNEPTLDDLQTGEKIGDFILEKELGRGAFGRVFFARQISLNREVALKITPNLGEEAMTMASLEHEGIVRVFSETVDPETTFRLLCMQYVPGVSLEKLIAELKDRPLMVDSGQEILNRIRQLSPIQGKFSPSEIKTAEQIEKFDLVQFITWIGIRVAQALSRSHTQKVLHLDVKPANVIINSLGIPFLTDFNVAIRSVEHKSKARIVGGTLDYMSPEHQSFLFDAEGSVDERTDVYSLGKLLKECLALCPEEAINPTQQELMGVYASELQRLLDRCLSANPKDRPQSTDLLASQLDALLQKREIAKQLPENHRLFRFGEKFPLIFIMLSVAFAHVVLTFVNIVHNQVRIVNELSAAQQSVFEKLVLFYNPTVYPLCIFFSLRVLWKIIPVLRRNQGYFDSPPEERANRRKKMLDCTFPIALITSAGWLPGTLFFSGGIHLLCGPVPGSVFIHFFIANFLCCVTGAVYSFIFVIPFLIRVIYPLTLVGEVEIRAKANSEIRHCLSYLMKSYRWAVLLPLLSIVLVLLFGVTTNQTTEGFTNLRILISTLALIAGAGFLFSFKGLEKCEKALVALTGQNVRT